MTSLDPEANRVENLALIAAATLDELYSWQAVAASGGRIGSYLGDINAEIAKRERKRAGRYFWASLIVSLLSLAVSVLALAVSVIAIYLAVPASPNQISPPAAATKTTTAQP